MVAKAVEHSHSMWKVGSLNPSRVNPMTYKIDTCHHLAWHLVLIGSDKDWFALHQDNVRLCGTLGHDTWCLFSLVRQHYEVTMILNVARM